MTLTQIEYVLAVAKEKSFPGAVQVRFVSQPTFSIQIQKMEGLVSALKSAILETLPNERRLPYPFSCLHYLLRLRFSGLDLLQGIRIPFLPPSISPFPSRNNRPTNAADTASSSSLVIFVVNPLMPRSLRPFKSPLRWWC